MRSSNLAKIDYGFARLLTVCHSFRMGASGATRIRPFPPLAQMEKGDELLAGNATVEERLAGFERSRERCSKLFDGAKLTDDEWDSIRTQPVFVQYLSVPHTFSAAKNFDSPEVIAAVSTIVAGPMFGALDYLLFSRLDYTELANAYGNERGAPLMALTVQAVLCRMGDDCGPGGTVTEHICWQFGICGNRVEDAILANLHHRGLDTAAFNQFVFRVHQALQTGNTSIFRKQVPAK